MRIGRGHRRAQERGVTFSRALWSEKEGKSRPGATGGRVGRWMSAKTGNMLWLIPLLRARAAKLTHLPRRLRRSFRCNARISSPRARCESELSRDRGKARAAHDQRVVKKSLIHKLHPHSESGAYRCSSGRAPRGVELCGRVMESEGLAQITPFLHLA